MTVADQSPGTVNETRSAILDAEVVSVLAEKLDDFKTLMQDSTAVEGNTASGPTDSHFAVALLGRCLQGWGGRSPSSSSRRSSRT